MSQPSNMLPFLLYPFGLNPKVSEDKILITHITPFGPHFSSIDQDFATPTKIKQTFLHFTNYISASWLEKISSNLALKINIMDITNQTLKLTYKVVNNIIKEFYRLQKIDNEKKLKISI